MIKVVTVRSYFYEDDKKELNASVPSIGDKENSNAENQVNKDVDELIRQMVDCFYEEYNQNANDFKSMGTVEFEINKAVVEECKYRFK